MKKSFAGALGTGQNICNPIFEFLAMGLIWLEY